MNTAAALLEAVSPAMQEYLRVMQHEFPDWWPLEYAAHDLLQGIPVDDSRFAPAFQPLLRMMRCILERTATDTWDWSDPAIQQLFAEVSGGAVYQLYERITVQMVSAIIRQLKPATIVEVGAGQGAVTAAVCRELAGGTLPPVTYLVTDQLAAVERMAAGLRQQYPELDLSAAVWNVTRACPPAVRDQLVPPVFVFERFCLAYAGYAGLETLGPLADVLLIVDDLSLTGRMYSFDKIYARIGSRFLVLEEARRHLDRHFSSVQVCDRAAIEATHSPVTTFVLAAAPHRSQ